MCVFIDIYIFTCIYIYYIYTFPKLCLRSRVLNSFVIIGYVTHFFQNRGLVGKGCAKYVPVANQKRNQLRQFHQIKQRRNRLR